MKPTNPNTDIESEAGWRDVFNLIQKGSVETQGTDLYAFLEPPLNNDEIGRFQHYRVLRKLGEGGMGIVFLAEDTHLKRRVALKILHLRIATEPAARQRFMREAQAMASIHHEHVVIVYQVGMARNRDSDLPFLAMQYLEGETLHKRLARAKRLPPVEAARIGREIAEGLAAAHAQGLIHRDIKPSNIWMADPGSSVKILDFGLARSADSDTEISHSGQIIGTPYFMAPEQARGEAVDARRRSFQPWLRPLCDVFWFTALRRAQRDGGPDEARRRRAGTAADESAGNAGTSRGTGASTHG